MSLPHTAGMGQTQREGVVYSNLLHLLGQTIILEIWGTTSIQIWSWRTCEQHHQVMIPLQKWLLAMKTVTHLNTVDGLLCTMEVRTFREVLSENRHFLNFSPKSCSLISITRRYSPFWQSKKKHNQQAVWRLLFGDQRKHRQWIYFCTISYIFKKQRWRDRCWGHDQGSGENNWRCFGAMYWCRNKGT